MKNRALRSNPIETNDHWNLKRQNSPEPNGETTEVDPLWLEASGGTVLIRPVPSICCLALGHMQSTECPQSLSNGIQQL